MANQKLHPKINIGKFRLPFEIMITIIGGNRVTKREWNNPNIFIYFDGHIKMNTPDGIYDLKTSEDLSNTDWVVL